jgi:hypothetical protein
VTHLQTFDQVKNPVSGIFLLVHPGSPELKWYCPAASVTGGIKAQIGQVVNTTSAAA